MRGLKEKKVRFFWIPQAQVLTKLDARNTVLVMLEDCR